MAVTARPDDTPTPRPVRRLACERCRSQKLRCIRENKNDPEPCTRCSQAQAACIICPRKAPGRPVGRKNSAPTPMNPMTDTSTGTTDTDPGLGAGFVFSELDLNENNSNILGGLFDFRSDPQTYAPDLMGIMDANGLPSDSGSSHAGFLPVAQATADLSSSSNWLSMANTTATTHVTPSPESSADPDLQLLNPWPLTNPSQPPHLTPNQLMAYTQRTETDERHLYDPYNVILGE